METADPSCSLSFHPQASHTVADQRILFAISSKASAAVWECELLDEHEVPFLCFSGSAGPSCRRASVNLSARTSCVANTPPAHQQPSQTCSMLSSLTHRIIDRQHRRVSLYIKLSHLNANVASICSRLYIIKTAEMTDGQIVHQLTALQQPHPSQKLIPVDNAHPARIPWRDLPSFQWWCPAALCHWMRLLRRPRWRPTIQLGHNLPP